MSEWPRGWELSDETISIVADHCFGPHPTTDAERKANEVAEVALLDALPGFLTAELGALADDIAGRVSADDNLTEFHVNQVCAAKLRQRIAEIESMR